MEREARAADAAEMKMEIQKLGVASLSEATSLKECVSALVRAYRETEAAVKAARAKWDEEMKSVSEASQQVLLLKERVEKIALETESGVASAAQTGETASVASTLVKEMQELIQEAAGQWECDWRVTRSLDALQEEKTVLPRLAVAVCEACDE